MRGPGTTSSPAGEGPECGPRGIVHDLETVFQMNYIPHCFVPLISQLFTTSFCISSEVYSPSSSRTRTCNIFNYLRVRAIDYEANTNFRACGNCYVTAQIKLFVM